MYPYTSHHYQQYIDLHILRTRPYTVITWLTALSPTHQHLFADLQDAPFVKIRMLQSIPSDGEIRRVLGNGERHFSKVRRPLVVQGSCQALELCSCKVQTLQTDGADARWRTR